MIRLYGALIMILASLWLGISQAAAMRRRPGVLTALADALDVLKSDTCVRLLPMPEALRNAEELSGAARPFFAFLTELSERHASLSDAWDRAADALKTLSAEDRMALRALGARLGRYDVQTQAEAIEQCVDALRVHAARAAEQAASGGKLSVGLCLAGGLLLAVILV